LAKTEQTQETKAKDTDTDAEGVTEKEPGQHNNKSEH
jgi:hypothetical protein